MKKKELTQEEMDFILGGEEIQLNSIAGATQFDNDNQYAHCECRYKNKDLIANNNDASFCKCSCTY